MLNLSTRWFSSGKHGELGDTHISFVDFPAMLPWWNGPRLLPSTDVSIKVDLKLLGRKKHAVPTTIDSNPWIIRHVVIYIKQLSLYIIIYTVYCDVFYLVYTIFAARHRDTKPNKSSPGQWWRTARFREPFFWDISKIYTPW